MAGSSRISPRPGPTYHSAAAACPRLLATFPSRDWTCRSPARYILPEPKTHPGTGGMLERTSSAAVGAADPGIGARRAVGAVLNALTMAALLWLPPPRARPPGGGAGGGGWCVWVAGRSAR